MSQPQKAGRKQTGVNSSFFTGLPWWLSSKESTCNTENTGELIQSLGQEAPLKEEMAAHFRYSCLDYPMGRELGGLQSMRSPKV